MKAYGHLSRIALGLTSSSCLILLLLNMLGMIPDQSDLTSLKRVNVAEAIVTQATVAMTLNDMASLRALLEISVRHNEDVRSIGLRNARGRILMATRDHDQLWARAPSEGSSRAHIRLPLFKDGKRWASLEISFSRSAPMSIAAELWARPVLKLVISMAVLGFVANLLFMKRILRHLDPSAVIPTRVQTALDVMTDGVLLIDEKERIVLANSAFCEQLNRKPASLIGLAASSLDWLPSREAGNVGELPWLEAIEYGEARIDVPISIIPDGQDDVVEFRVSGSPVLDGWQRSKGAIVTFKDVTQLENQRRELEDALAELGKSRDEIRFQNEELTILAQTDSLTGMANRRTFMENYDRQFENVTADGDSLVVLMIDIDFFKKVNDGYGHAMGDEVICRVAEILKGHQGANAISGRYGGEEFCLALRGLDAEAATAAAERIRKTIAAPGFARVPTSVSIGISSTEFGAHSPTALIEEADKSLYAAKNQGRNRVVRYDQITAESGATT